MSRASSVLALALVPLAFVAGWFLGSSDPGRGVRAGGASPNGSPTLASGVLPGRSGSAPAVLAPVEAAVPGAPAATPDVAERTVSPEEVERLTRRIVQPTAAGRSGSLSLSGTVVDDLGQPLADVLVRATPTDWKPSGTDPNDVGVAPPERPSFQDWVAERAEEFAEEQATTVEATTDATGSFALTGLPAGKLTLKAFAEGWTFDVPGNLKVPWLTTLEVEGSRVFDVPVRVEREDGSPLAEAEVYANALDSGRGDRTFRWTPDQAFVRLPAGNWELTARQRALDHPTAKQTVVARSEETTLSFFEDALPGETVLVLEPSTTLIGQLRIQPAPSDETWYRVVLEELDPGEDLSDTKAILKDPDRDEWTRTEFTFTKLDPGRYALGVLDQNSWNDPDAPFLALREVQLVEGFNEVELSVEAPEPSTLLVVEVTGPDQRPLAGCDFVLHVRDDDGTDSNGIRKVEARGGTYELDPQGAKKTLERARKGGSLHLVVHHQLYGDVHVPISADATSAEAAFAAVGFLEVTVAGWERAEDDGVALSIDRPEDQVAWYEPDVDEHEDGFWRFGPMQPGRYVVSLRVKSHRWQWNSIEERTVDVPAGTMPITMELPVLHALRVHANGAKDDAWAWLRPVGRKRTAERKGGNYRAQLDESLTCTFENLEAGEYLLTVGGLDGMARVRVPGADVEFVGRAPDSMQVTIQDEEGLWGDVGLEDGDLIVGVGGTLFENEQQSMALYEPGVTWTVWRAGETLELVAPSEPFGDRSRLGVNLTPTVRPDRR